MQCWTLKLILQPRWLTWSCHFWVLISQKSKINKNADRNQKNITAIFICYIFVSLILFQLVVYGKTYPVFFYGESSVNIKVMMGCMISIMDTVVDYGISYAKFNSYWKCLNTIAPLGLPTVTDKNSNHVLCEIWDAE